MKYCMLVLFSDRIIQHSVWMVIIIVKVLLIAGSIVLPLLMIYVQCHWKRMSTLLNILMILSAITFGNITALSIYQIIRDNTVFMTAIHGVFLNPLFLVTGIYIGLYTIYRLLLLSKKEWDYKK